MFCWLFLVVVRERLYIFVNIWGEMVIPFLGCSFARTWHDGRAWLHYWCDYWFCSGFIRSYQQLIKTWS